ncbi:hypothetical protein MGG_16949 [Pyricularia oryzae 70-15]|uniref:Uncharacterized protein n=2 Tax=Pyricularia oryzae TaxID=318829 RepID=G4N1X9_PYRO7|nr:uncharacterized protein MGG_16949 [Pyricularia oryzae 70-15]EHA53289.1 hypothetical protein MGG_16949 [Pyricularia oryzae 70-15]
MGFGGTDLSISFQRKLGISLSRIQNVNRTPAPQACGNATQLRRMELLGSHRTQEKAGVIQCEMQIS